MRHDPLQELMIGFQSDTRSGHNAARLLSPFCTEPADAHLAVLSPPVREHAADN